MTKDEVIQHLVDKENEYFSKLKLVCPQENQKEFEDFRSQYMKRYENPEYIQRVYDEYSCLCDKEDSETNTRHQSPFDKIENLQDLGYRRFIRR